MSFSRSGAYERAMDVVKAALAGGQLKLEGPNSQGHGPGQLTADSQYLNGLINSIAENLLEKQKQP